MSRPRRLVVVAGTATGVGKTWVGARLAETMVERGLRVAVRKPVQSFDPGDAGRTDADVLAAAACDEPATVCPPHRWYPLAMAPPIAAEVLGAPAFRVAELAAEVHGSWPPDELDVGLVELAGGPRSPVAADGDGVDLTRMLEPDRCVLVADAGLGTINAVRLCAAVLAPVPLVVMLNRYDAGDEVHRRNRDWLDRCLDTPTVVGVAELAGRVTS